MYLCNCLSLLFSSDDEKFNPPPLYYMYKMCIVNEYSDYSINEHLSEMYNEMCGHYLQIKWHKVIYKKNVNKVNCYGGPLETHVHTHTHKQEELLI